MIAWQMDPIAFTMAIRQLPIARKTLWICRTGMLVKDDDAATNITYTRDDGTHVAELGVISRVDYFGYEGVVSELEVAWV